MDTFKSIGFGSHLYLESHPFIETQTGKQNIFRKPIRKITGLKWNSTQATKVMVSVAPGLGLSAPSKVSLEDFSMRLEVPFAK